MKYFGNEDYEAQCYDNELAQWERARRQNRLSLFALNAGQAFIIATAMTSAMVLAAKDTLSGSMTIGDFVLINAFMMQIFMPLNFLGFVYVKQVVFVLFSCNSPCPLFLPMIMWFHISLVFRLM